MINRFTHTNGHYFMSGGTQLYYEECGTANAPVLLFLHGGFGDMENFNVMLPFFADRYRIIGLDTRGHGRSYLGREKLTYALLQKDVEALVAFLHLDRLSIIGFSDGGITAYRCAAFSGIGIDKLITIGAKWSTSDMMLMKQICADMTPSICREMFAENYGRYSQLNSEPQFDHFAKSVLKMWLDDSENGLPDDRISAINLPLLVIRGNDDPLFSLESAVKLLLHIKNAQFLNIPFASHEAYKDQMDSVVYFSQLFLTQNRS